MKSDLRCGEAHQRPGRLHPAGAMSGGRCKHLKQVRYGGRSLPRRLVTSVSEIRTDDVRSSVEMQRTLTTRGECHDVLV